jgi:hypothetical protein
MAGQRSQLDGLRTGAENEEDRARQGVLVRHGRQEESQADAWGWSMGPEERGLHASKESGVMMVCQPQTRGGRRILMLT